MFGQTSYTSRYGFAPNFNLPPELTKIQDPKAQDAEAAKLNSQIRAQIVELIAQLGTSPIYGREFRAEGQNILEDLLKTQTSFKYHPHPYKNAPMFLSYKAALQMVQELGSPDILTPEQELELAQQILPGQGPKPSFIRENFQVIVVGGGVMFFGLLGALLLLKS